jgi:hypothetical protein
VNKEGTLLMRPKEKPKKFHQHIASAINSSY